MIVKIIDKRVSAILWKNKYLPTNVDIDLSVSDILHFSRRNPIEFNIPTIDYNPETWKNKQFVLIGDADSTSGFGNCTTNLITQSIKNKYDIRWIGKQYEVPQLTRYNYQDISTDMGVVFHEQPKQEWLTLPFQKKLAIVPFETTRIPKSWVYKINSLDAIMVPCSQNVQMMKDSGVTIPIEEIRWGVNTKEFPLLKRNNKYFTFGQMGALSLRKGTDTLISAFKKAFPIEEYPNVRLLLKTSNDGFLFETKDDRIKVQIGKFNKKELLDNFLQQIDCFVFPTRGEGAGLPPLEAMATGLPVICTDWSGPKDYLPIDYTYWLKYKMVPATDFSKKIYKEPCGDWAEPDEEHLIELMRYCYNNQDEAKKMGELGSKWVHKNMTWDKNIHLFFDVLNKYFKK
jgi:glycosyltransferase involved in cell wall biosynthesis